MDLANTKPQFHFWGNYWYGASYFSPQLVSLFPNYTHFNLRDVPRLLGSLAEETKGDEPLPGSAATTFTEGGSSRDLLDQAFDTVYRLGRPFVKLSRFIFPHPEYRVPTEEVFAGEGLGAPVTVIVIGQPTEGLVAQIGLDNFVELVDSRLRVTEAESVLIAGQDYFVLKLRTPQTPD